MIYLETSAYRRKKLTLVILFLLSAFLAGYAIGKARGDAPAMLETSETDRRIEEILSR